MFHLRLRRAEALSEVGQALRAGSTWRPLGIKKGDWTRQPRRGSHALREGLSPHALRSSEEVQPLMRTAMMLNLHQPDG
jgi:hypothetical protein